MKKYSILLIVALTMFQGAFAQVVSDTVYTGAGYASQVWYSLENDNQGSSPKGNWDIAFDATGFGTSIYVNTVGGTVLWHYPKGDTAKWASVDTSGITGWTKVYNSDTSWSLGAFDRGMVLSNPYDLGWGEYNGTTHIVTGDSLYIIKLSNGVYKKLWIESLNGGIYYFKYADLDGGNLQMATVTKSFYAGKNFAYYSLQSNSALDREPLSANWDLVFGQYNTFIPTPYVVTGILHNKGVKVAQAKPVADPAAYTNWSAHTFNTAINEIGYDWKVFSGSFVIEDSLVYFVKTKGGDIWKLIPTGFGGSATGAYMFSKEKLKVSKVKNTSGAASATLSLYPNPSEGSVVSLVYDFNQKVTHARVIVQDLKGRQVYADKLDNAAGLKIYSLNTAQMNRGIYLVTLSFDGGNIQQKLVIK